MKTYSKYIALILAVSAILVGIATSRGHRDDLSGHKAIVEGNNRFALELYAGLLQDPEALRQGGNVFFSPYSISTALAMTYAGARGETAKQMAKTLRFTLGQQQLHRAFGSHIRRLNEQGKKGNYELAVANALWGQTGYTFLDSFLRLLERTYGAGLKEVDFAGATEQARLTINKWVEDKTKERIRDLIRPGVLNELTTLVLTNAIYFKGDWLSKFDEDNTRARPFHISSDRSINVPMMYQSQKFNYADRENLQILELPYKGGDLSMIVLLPKQVDGISNLERSLTVEKLKLWLKALRSRKVNVFLPKFKLTWGAYDLTRLLGRMGMKDAFSLPPADFSGITGKKDLFISNVVHKAFVAVDEEGTEAAAATAVAFRKLAVVDVPVFRADHPFVFMIRDNQSGAILFMGRVVNPAEAG